MTAEVPARFTVQVILSRKGAKKRTHGRKLRSTGTKARTRVGRSPDSRAELEKKLKAHASDLEKKLEARTRELAGARELSLLKNISLGKRFTIEEHS
jgi:hypothetical protein